MVKKHLEFEDIITDLMDKLDKEDEFVFDASNVNAVDKAVIIETIEDMGYKVDASYGVDDLYIHR